MGGIGRRLLAVAVASAMGLVPLTAAASVDNAQADELWTQMLELCPPQHRPLLELKKQGLSLDEIAARTGLHPSSVRRAIHPPRKCWVPDSDAGARAAALYHRIARLGRRGPSPATSCGSHRPC